MVLGWQLPDADGSCRLYRDQADVITRIGPCWYPMDTDGNSKSEEEVDTLSFARASGTVLMPLIVNDKFSSEITHEILVTENTRLRAAENIASLVREAPAAGGTLVVAREGA